MNMISLARHTSNVSAKSKLPAMIRKSLRLGACVSVCAVLAGCGAPKRGESELEYKNRVAKYTITGVLIGGFLGAKSSNILPNQIIHFKHVSDKNMFFTAFYAALGGYAGHSLIKYEGEIQRMLFKLQNQLASSSHQALSAEDMGQSHAWTMPEENAVGAFIVTDRYIGSQGFACQDMVADVSVGAESESVLQTACQNAAGQWVLWTRGSVQG